jgi:hypothetical protein
VGALNLAGPSAGASWALMADRSKLQRGTALLLPPEGARWVEAMVNSFARVQCGGADNYRACLAATRSAAV